MQKYIWIIGSALSVLTVTEYIVRKTNCRMDAMRALSTDEFSNDTSTEDKEGTVNNICSNEKQSRKYRHTWIVSGVMALIYAGMMVFLYDHMTSFVALIQFALLYAGTACAAVTDFKIQKIPNIITFGLLAAGVVTALVKFIFVLIRKQGELSEFATSWLLWNLLATVGVMLLLAVVSRVSGNGFGYGDVKLLGAFCFTGGLSAMLSSTVAGLIVCTFFSIGALLLKKRGLKDQLPFAPFFYIGFLIAAMLGMI